jgi:hypothetical protein
MEPTGCVAAGAALPEDQVGPVVLCTCTTENVPTTGDCCPIAMLLRPVLLIKPT